MIKLTIALPLASAEANGTLDVKDIVEGVQSAARETLEHGTSIVQKPVFTRDAAQRKLYYNLGAIKRGASGFAPDDPDRLPFEQQLHVEMLRQSLLAAFPQQGFWKPALSAAESQIAAAVNDIQATSDKTQLQRKLANRKRQIDDAYQSLEEQLHDYSIRIRYEAISETRAPASDTFSVEIKTIPDGGIVRAMPLLIYYRCMVKHLPRQQWPWKTLAANPAQLIGTYRVWVTWSGGKKFEDSIDVPNANPLTFRPEP